MYRSASVFCYSIKYRISIALCRFMGTNLNSKGMLVSSELRLDSILKDRLIVDLFLMIHQCKLW